MASADNNATIYVVAWEFQVREGAERAFERAYGPQGEWVQFFRQGAGFLGSIVHRDVHLEGRYVILDCWSSEAAYLRFKQERAQEYRRLDREYEELFEVEKPLGAFLSLEGAAGSGLDGGLGHVLQGMPQEAFAQALEFFD